MGDWIAIKCDYRVVRRLAPGQTITVGRNSENTWVLNDSSISRAHARLSWAKDEPRPRITDLGSSNGCFLDGIRIPAHEDVVLTSGASLGLGDLEFELDRLERPDGPALLSDSGSGTVVMFGDSRAGRSGTLETWSDTRRLLERLETKRRSGQLTFHMGGETREVTLILGAFALQPDEARMLLGELHSATEVAYSYSPEFQVGDRQDTGVLPSKLLGAA